MTLPMLKMKKCNTCGEVKNKMLEFTVKRGKCKACVAKKQRDDRKKGNNVTKGWNSFIF